MGETQHERTRVRAGCPMLPCVPACEVAMGPGWWQVHFGKHRGRLGGTVGAAVAPLRSVSDDIKTS